VVPAALPAVSPPLPPPSTSVDTSLTYAHVNQQIAEIQRLPDEVTSPNGICEALKLKLSALTADLEARRRVSEQDSVIDLLNRDLAAANNDRHAALRCIDAVIKWLFLII
jgi:uncharacterized coiled-coil protein SlyX